MKTKAQKQKNIFWLILAIAIIVLLLMWLNGSFGYMTKPKAGDIPNCASITDSSSKCNETNGCRAVEDSSSPRQFRCEVDPNNWIDVHQTCVIEDVNNPWSDCPAGEICFTGAYSNEPGLSGICLDPRETDALAPPSLISGDENTNVEVGDDEMAGMAAAYQEIIDNLNKIDWRAVIEEVKKAPVGGSGFWNPNKDPKLFGKCRSPHPFNEQMICEECKDIYGANCATINF